MSILRTFPSEPGTQRGPIAIPAACTVRNVRNFLKKYLTDRKAGGIIYTSSDNQTN